MSMDKYRRIITYPTMISMNVSGSMLFVWQSSVFTVIMEVIPRFWDAALKDSWSPLLMSKLLHCVGTHIPT
jgi:hypothetical protein